MNKTFEEVLAELEAIVAKLEAGDLPLEQSLELFEQGVAMSRECRTRLENAERRIQVLVQKADGEVDAEEMDIDSLR